MRQYMIDYRAKHNISIDYMAKRCKCSVTLLSMLESREEEVTHPKIAERIAMQYKLNQEQYESLLPENYRPTSPKYNPDEYKIDVDFGTFSIMPTSGWGGYYE